jgi:hypothetical protein
MVRTVPWWCRGPVELGQAERRRVPVAEGAGDAGARRLVGGHGVHLGAVVQLQDVFDPAQER